MMYVIKITVTEKSSQSRLQKNPEKHPVRAKCRTLCRRDDVLVWTATSEPI